MHISAKRICKNKCVAAVVLRTGNCVAITEAIQLLRIDGKDAIASIEQSLDYCASWNFDAYRKAPSGFSGFFNNPVQKLLNARPTMAYIPLADLPAASIQRAILCSSVAQSMPKKNTNLSSNRFHLDRRLSRPAVLNIAPVLALFGANSPQDVAPSHFVRVQFPSRRCDASGPGWHS